ncbi:MAG: ATP synthase F1 subunit gamma [Omnitrophica bacterium RIFCSPHIGHO2_02_FULL_46_11]|nr:MAG: ATP synthase F1 subunit gamma [Omnitrophica bacterium RIFCSPLOWO2_01_FULL_45_10b]OGW87847.1 MAG: ATP synthase F1 subunit gamma [Omnitrophica bacterium RIFCSPHIGHO2_02_FULL_46_11]
MTIEEIMLSLRQIRQRIKSVGNTKKMTHAMEMVAAAKLKKLQDLLRQSDRYIAELRRILETLVREKPLAHPLLEKRTEIKNTLAFLITSDTGLCGSYNLNVWEQADRLIKAENLNRALHFVAIGRHGAAYLKRAKQTISKELPVPRPHEIDETIRLISQIATDEFTHHKADEVIFIYTKVMSLGSLKPASASLFPIVSLEKEMAAIETPTDYLLEPSLEEIIALLLPEFIEAEMNQFVKHSLVAEQASRMMAMRQATDSAKDMIDSLTLLRNKARQASITKELLEVVSGSRALQLK